MSGMYSYHQMHAYTYLCWLHCIWYMYTYTIYNAANTSAYMYAFDDSCTYLTCMYILLLTIILKNSRKEF